MASEMVKSSTTGATGSIRQLLESRRDQFQQIIPKHLTADRLIKVALNSVAKTPKLQQCTPASLLQCVITCAELGLDPGGALGHAYLVPYGTQCTLILGYRGMIELARRSGQLEQIEAHIVREGDEFKLEFGLTPTLKHVPKLDGEPGRPVLAYMVARLKGGPIHCEVMTFSEIEAIRKRSRSGNNGPWVTDWAEMARKTVVRRGMKYLPMSVELARALDAESEDDAPAIGILPVPEEPEADAPKELPEPQRGQVVEAETPAPGNERAKAAVAAKRMMIEDIPAGAEG